METRAENTRFTSTLRVVIDNHDKFDAIKPSSREIAHLSGERAHTKNAMNMTLITFSRMLSVGKGDPYITLEQNDYKQNYLTCNGIPLNGQYKYVIFDKNDGHLSLHIATPSLPHFYLALTDEMHETIQNLVKNKTQKEISHINIDFSYDSVYTVYSAGYVFFDHGKFLNADNESFGFSNVNMDVQSAKRARDKFSLFSSDRGNKREVTSDVREENENQHEDKKTRTSLV